MATSNFRMERAQTDRIAAIELRASMRATISLSSQWLRVAFVQRQAFFDAFGD
jgi:hypothetical protein